LQELILNWNSQSLAPVLELLSKHETLSESLEIIHQYLDRARQHLRSLPASGNHAGLMGLTDYLARQTDTLGVCA
jgi:geranylgeranyl pyrophosphate synthase